MLSPFSPPKSGHKWRSEALTRTFWVCLNSLADPAMRFRLSVLLGGLACVLFLVGCGSTQPPRAVPQNQSQTGPSAHRAEALRTAAQEWSGTPHVWGGTTRRGVDCSGLVQSVYREVLGTSIPRTTKAQSRTGQAVRASSLQPGDLVFFRVDSRKGRHVGIYLSDGAFLHASASEGVTVGQLRHSYWQDRWWQARRILSTHDSESTPPTSQSSNPRTGW